MLKYFIFLSLMISCFGKTTFIPDDQGNLLAQKEQMNWENDKNFEKPNFQKAFVKMMASLVGIIVLCIITFWAFKKITRSRMHTSNNIGIKILEKKILSPKTMLYVVEYENKKTLISESHLDIKIKLLKEDIKKSS